MSLVRCGRRGGREGGRCGKKGGRERVRRCGKKGDIEGVGSMAGKEVNRE